MKECLNEWGQKVAMQPIDRLLDELERVGQRGDQAACRTYADNVGNAYGVWGGQLYEDGKIIGGERDESE